MHFNQVVYRDLNPSNILVSSDGYLKIADFEISKDNVLEFNDGKRICVKAEYRSPEVLSNHKNQNFGHAADWWSFGIIIYQMLGGTPPFFT